MKNLVYLLAILMLASCTSVRMIDSWKSKEYDNYQPKKILIIGITENLIARKKFEERLRLEFQNRGIDAVESYDVFTSTFSSSKQSENDIQKEMQRVKNQGFGAVLISAVKGVDQKTNYSMDTYFRDYYWRRWGHYYFLYQDVYFVEGYYTDYNVYHIETTLYNLENDSDKSLVWVGAYDIVNPDNISDTVSDYVNAIIKSLENENFIRKKS
ncbi:MAG: hypothetical protein HKP48_03710 [Winogradskyella sp.]|uniref:hypothetical protein n=1 Tax=Winogradskyella sp. TaxID=1883156 RepID=UPI001810B0B9|nr:hypothetical protein [Winogradskyella sp.]MBT8244457.1 hypothetical protein [Winogradskyella sp.]NNK22409.1 hypothetical protein [Winogradskyella sp.]